MERKIIKHTIALFSISTLIYAIIYIFFVLLSPLPYKFMDFNKNEWVELNEAFTAIDIGTRNIENNDKNCLEYFYLKDGIQAYLYCE